MITDYVPGAYMTHDMLHMRGGHQTSWLIDGVAIPNTKIASNVGPQIDPKDIDSWRRSAAATTPIVGDRTYGVFNVLPRNGFEFNRDGELLLYGGQSLHRRGAGFAGRPLGEDGVVRERDRVAVELRAGDAGDRDLSRRDEFGERICVADSQPDGEGSAARGWAVPAGLSFRFRTTRCRTTTNATIAAITARMGLRDGQTERDSFVIANWVHTISPKALFSVAPFYHFNQSDYDSRRDGPCRWRRRGIRTRTMWARRPMRASMRGGTAFPAGLYSFYQRENDLFGVLVNDGSGPSQPNTPANANAGLVEFYLGDHLRLGQYVTLLGGERFSIYRAGLNESATYPRIGATVRIPQLNWVLRGFYGHFFQPAPILTVSSSVLNYASSLGGGENTFTPLPSERDEEHQFGIEIPYRGWMLDVDTFKNRVNNFLDHSNLGESNMYFPIAVDGALVRAWEMTLHSPSLWRYGQFYVTYSNQIAEQRGNIIGGFTCSIPTDPACDLGPDYTPARPRPAQHAEHGIHGEPAGAHVVCNQCVLRVGIHEWAGCAIRRCPDNGPYYGSVSAGAHDVRCRRWATRSASNWKLSATVINVTNHRVLLDNSITIGGFHWNDPRMIAVEARYRFQF